MSIDLVNLSFVQKNLSSSEHSILNILSFRANDDYFECWPSIASLKESSSLDRKTILKVIQSLIDKKLIEKTGEMRGKTKSTPVFKVLLSSPKIGTAKNSSSPNFSGTCPNFGTSKQSQFWDMERSDLKGKRKDPNFSKNVTQEQKQEIKFYLENPKFSMPKKLKELVII